MAQISFWEHMKRLFSIIGTSPFFISLVVISILTIIILLVNAKVKDSLVRIFAALGYTFIVAFIFIQYGNSVITLSDNLFQNIFSTIYFPSLISYICMILAAVLLLLRTIINNKMSSIMRLLNVSSFIIIVFLFILTLDVIVKNNIDIYSKAAVYTNESLVVLIQSSMAIFAIWLVLIGIAAFINVLVKNSEKEPVKVEHKSIRMFQRLFMKKSKKTKEEKELVSEVIIPYIPEENDFEGISVLSEEEFHKGFLGFKKSQVYKQKDNK